MGHSHPIRAEVADTAIDLMEHERWVAEAAAGHAGAIVGFVGACLLYTSPSPRD